MRIHVSGLTIGDKEYPKGVPVEANEVLERMAVNKERREGIVAVTFVDAHPEAPKTEAPKEGSPDPEVPLYREGTPPSNESASSEPDRKVIMATLKAKGVKFFAGAKTEDLLAKLKEAGE